MAHKSCNHEPEKTGRIWKLYLLHDLKQKQTSKKHVRPHFIFWNVLVRYVMGIFISGNGKNGSFWTAWSLCAALWLIPLVRAMISKCREKKKGFSNWKVVQAYQSRMWSCSTPLHRFWTHFLPVSLNPTWMCKMKLLIFNKGNLWTSDDWMPREEETGQNIGFTWKCLILRWNQPSHMCPYHSIIAQWRLDKKRIWASADLR